MSKRRTTAPADYIFVLEEMHPRTGLYGILGVTAEEGDVAHFLDHNTRIVKRVSVFTLGQQEGPVRIINSIEEFEELQ